MPQLSPTPKANLATFSINLPWHHIVGHPSDQIMRQMHLLPQIKLRNQPPCISCNIVKSHKLPFSMSSLTSSKPPELMYTDVWGPTSIKSIDGYSYYLIIVDHFTKYNWLYTLKNKSDVSLIFPKFKSLVEKYFNLPIITLHSHNGGEFIKLKNFLSDHGISHFTTPPHTPELNAPAERRHRHIVETGKALLHTAKLPLSFWSYAFRTAAYLINRLPTPILNMKSPSSNYFIKPSQTHCTSMPLAAYASLGSVPTPHINFSRVQNLAYLSAMLILNMHTTALIPQPTKYIPLDMSNFLIMFSHTPTT